MMRLISLAVFGLLTICAQAQEPAANPSPTPAAALTAESASATLREFSYLAATALLLLIVVSVYAGEACSKCGSHLHEKGL